MNKRLLFVILIIAVIASLASCKITVSSKNTDPTFSQAASTGAATNLPQQTTAVTGSPAATSPARTTPAPTQTKSTPAPTTSAPVQTPSQTQEIDAFINSFNVKTGEITFDRIEWVSLSNKKRMGELGLTEEDLPNGFYIYNEIKKNENITAESKTEYYVINLEVTVQPVKTGAQGFHDSLKDWPVPYKIAVKDGKVIKIEEQYVP